MSLTGEQIKKLLVEKHIFLTKKGISIIKDEYDEDLISKIRKELTVIPFVAEDYGIPPKGFPVYLESPKKIYMPKHYALKLLGAPTSIKSKKPTKINITFAGSLKPTQLEPVAKYLETCVPSEEYTEQSLIEKTNGGIISLPCGWGKTVIALYLIAKLGLKALIIVHKDFLVNQWKKRIEEFLPDAKIGKIQQNKQDVVGKDIVIGMLQSISMKTYPDWIFEDIGTVIVDECFPYNQTIVTEEGIEYIGKIVRKFKNGSPCPYVKSYDEKTAKFVWKRITHVWEKESEEELLEMNLGGEVVRSTKNHKFLTSRGWVEANDICIGDMVISHKEGLFHYVESKKTIQNNDKLLYDIEVEDTHTFLLGEEGIVVHNCHHISSEVFSRALPKISSQYMLGLSATPERTDKLDRVMKWHLGPMLFSVVQQNTKKVRVNMVYYSNPNPVYSGLETLPNGKPCISRMTNNVTEFDRRNALILEIMRRVSLPHETHILTLSDRREHLRYLHDQIVERDLGSTGYYVGGMKEKQLNESEEKKIILSTFSMSSEALDIASLNTLILMTSHSGGNVHTQSCGRILRKSHDDIVPTIWDIVDNFSVYRSQAEKRMKYYKKQGFEIYKTTVADNDERDINDMLSDLDNLTEMKMNKYKKKEIELAKEAKVDPKQMECLIDD